EFRVQDNGIGIDEAEQEKVFEIFLKLHGRQEYEGSGIGLAVCKKIVMKHGGVLTLESKKDEGSTFIFYIPEKQV
ncbi:ATP-binding protein, partial [Candidatus Riflebacteria bacterium]